MPFEKDPNEIGCLWQRSGAKGAYMTGEIAGQQVVIFPITSTNPKAPNWRVLKSVPQDRKPHDANTTRPTDDDEFPFS